MWSCPGPTEICIVLCPSGKPSKLRVSSNSKTVPVSSLCGPDFESRSGRPSRRKVVWYGGGKGEDRYKRRTKEKEEVGVEKLNSKL